MTVNFNDNTLLTITDTILVFEEHCLLHFHLFSFLGLVFNLGKEVHIVAVGIGRKINTKPLELIAGKNGAVFNVASFQKLQEEIDKIKSSVCSGTLSLILVSRKQVVYNLDYLFGSVCPVSTVFSLSSLYFDRLCDINQRGCG